MRNAAALTDFRMEDIAPAAVALEANMTEAVDATALTQIPWFNPKAADGRQINLMPYWDGTQWNMYIFHAGKAIRMQIVDVEAADYLAAAPQRRTDIRIPFAETMWQRASYPETIRFVVGILDDFTNFSASVAKIKFLHLKRNELSISVISVFVKTEIEYLLSLARGVFDLLQELLSVLWKSYVRLHDSEKERVRKARAMPESFAAVALKEKKEIRSAEEIAQKWALPEPLAVEYTRIAPFFFNLRNWRDHVIHSGGKVGPIFVADDGFEIVATSKLFSWANCWSEKEIGPNGLASLDPWLATVIFGSMEACNRFMLTFAQIIQLPEPIAPGLMVFSRNSTDEALHELKRIYDEANKARKAE
jgi:hypothetical protein